MQGNLVYEWLCPVCKLTRILWFDEYFYAFGILRDYYPKQGWKRFIGLREPIPSLMDTKYIVKCHHYDGVILNANFEFVSSKPIDDSLAECLVSAEDY